MTEAFSVKLHMEILVSVCIIERLSPQVSHPTASDHSSVPAHWAACDSIICQRGASYHCLTLRPYLTGLQLLHSDSLRAAIPIEIQPDIYTSSHRPKAIIVRRRVQSFILRLSAWASRPHPRNSLPSRCWILPLPTPSPGLTNASTRAPMSIPFSGPKRIAISGSS